MSPLSGRNAVITGAGRGIGAAAAIALAEAGVHVALVARNMKQVVAVAGELREEGRDAVAIQCDVADPHQVRDMWLSAREAMGPVDILVNNAGTATSNPLTRVTVEEWHHMLGVNLTGTFYCTQVMIPDMVERGWGRVVNVASIAGLEGGKYIAAYAASKHGVLGFTKSVAMEMEGTGVTVNAVCPGYVDTPLTDETVARIMQKLDMDAEAAMALLLRDAGQPRLIRATEVADAITLLCLDGAGERTGEAVVLDGNQGDS